MIAELEAEVERQALERNHEVIVSILLRDDVYICSYGKAFFHRMKVGKRLKGVTERLKYKQYKGGKWGQALQTKEELQLLADALVHELKVDEQTLLEAIKCDCCPACIGTNKVPSKLTNDQIKVVKYWREYEAALREEHEISIYDDIDTYHMDDIEDYLAKEKLSAGKLYGFNLEKALTESKNNVIINPHTFEPE